jgi:hypothetical protein
VELERVIKRFIEVKVLVVNLKLQNSNTVVVSVSPGILGESTRYLAS